MGVVSTISHDKFPKQGHWLNRKVSACFNWDIDNRLDGIIVRDDAEEPYRTIIKLDNGNYVLATECQFSLR